MSSCCCSHDTYKKQADSDQHLMSLLLCIKKDLDFMLNYSPNCNSDLLFHHCSCTHVQQHGVAGCTCKSEGFHRLCFQFQIKLHLVLLPTFQTYSKDTWSVLLWLCAEAFKTLRELRKPLLPAQCGDASLKHLSRPWLQPKWLRHCRGTVGTQVRSLSDVISWSSPISLPHFHSPSHNVLSS